MTEKEKLDAKGIIVFVILMTIIVAMIGNSLSGPDSTARNSAAYDTGYMDGASMARGGAGLAEGWAIEALSKQKYSTRADQSSYKSGYKDGWNKGN